MFKKIIVIILNDGELGLKLKLLIEVKKIDRKELVKKMNAVFSNEKRKPLNEITLRAYETGRRSFSFIFVVKLCEVLNVDIRYFTEDLSKLVENKDSLNEIFDIRKTASLYSKLNNLIKILDKISEKDITDQLIKFLDTFEKK